MIFKTKKKLYNEFLILLSTSINQKIEISMGNQMLRTDPIWIISSKRNELPAFVKNDCNSLFALSHTTIKETLIPILEFYGSNHGKSKAHKSLKDFAYNALLPQDENFRIGYSTQDDWDKNIRSVDTRFKGEAIDAHFFGWNSRLFLDNIDQSHHLAAIYRQALEQNRDYNVNCTLKIWHSNTDLSPLWIKGYHCFYCSKILSHNAIYNLAGKLGISLTIQEILPEITIVFIFKLSDKQAEQFRNMFFTLLEKDLVSLRLTQTPDSSGLA